MTEQKFIEQMSTLAKFLKTHCDDKHLDEVKNKININLFYNGKKLNFTVSTTLCKDCEVLFKYAQERLLACPHEIKPSCRKCPHPCYERDKWRQMAKIMRYSGIKLGLIEIKNLFKF